VIPEGRTGQPRPARSSPTCRRPRPGTSRPHPRRSAHHRRHRHQPGQTRRDPPPDPMAPTGGRGLLLVEAVSAAWSVHPTTAANASGPN